MRFVVRHGRRLYADGVVHYFFGRDERQRLQSHWQEWLARLEGVVVVMALDGQTIMTTYRNQKALKHIRKKAAWHRREISHQASPQQLVVEKAA